MKLQRFADCFCLHHHSILIRASTRKDAVASAAASASASRGSPARMDEAVCNLPLRVSTTQARTQLHVEVRLFERSMYLPICVRILSLDPYKSAALGIPQAEFQPNYCLLCVVSLDLSRRLQQWHSKIGHDETIHTHHS
jgi:hypothetical protein